MNRRQLFSGLLGIPLVAVASTESKGGWWSGKPYVEGQGTPDIKITKLVIDSKTIEQEVRRVIDEVLKENNELMIKQIKDQHMRGVM